ncbi:MAG TPA: MerR family transcriptional regulator [Aliidongia sp.]|uniref:MerR family transcriptional regulator n=1 Tax=Aliidongia sp. TaxID=1914230 RepID=UPI002DDD0CF5|nr:MerR family transcriptional regulator [Aliidongia sp.]HEV2677122.1 MerR family transcriptional regulator [Aliidongia sp.]
MSDPLRTDGDEPARRVVKSATAFRTISEVADELDVPQHVLRFWETKFPQIRPLKRGGGRRYYRPEDVELLRRVAKLLYQEGYTIKGVQRLLREGALKPGAGPSYEEMALPLGLEELDADLVVPDEPEPVAKPTSRRRALDATTREVLGDLLVELEAIKALLTPR